MLACRRRSILVFCLSVAFCAVPIVAAAQGRIEGTLTRKSDAAGIGGALVVIDQTGAADVTDSAGHYRFDKIAAGRYTVRFTLGEYAETESVTVATGIAKVATSVDWPLAFSETVTVIGASRHVERVLDAPAAVTVISADEIAHHASDSQLPRLLASSPGVELTQSSLYSFSLNMRGFNTLNGRRLPVFIDGRDPSTPVVLGNQEWGALPVPLDELAGIELVRGPSAALYGAGAFNGVVNITTKAPRDSPGGQWRVTFGELHTAGVSARQAGRIGARWFYRVSGASQRSRDFTKSRVDSIEYDGLPTEVAPVPDRAIIVTSGAARVDRYAGTFAATFEGGTANARGVTSVTSAGRSFATDVQRPWARVNFNWPGWNVLGYYTGRLADDLRSLNAGSSIYLTERSLGLELQHHRLFARGRGQLVAGAAYRRQDVNSLDPAEHETVFAAAESATQGSLFSQIDWTLSPRLKGVLSGRWETSTLHDARFSPRAAVVWTPAPAHTIRLNYSDAFQSPSLVEFFLRVPVAPPVDLSALEAALAPLAGGVPLGLGSVPLLAVGNPHLVVERIGTIEAGYSGVVGKRIWIGAGFFHNKLRDFTSNLLPQTGTSLGRVNPEYGPYVPPAALSTLAAATVVGALQSALPMGLFSALSNDASGRPVFALLSFANSGRASANGVDATFTYWPRPDWRFDTSYSFFGFRLGSQAAEAPISANTPRHQVALSGTYAGARDGASLKYRWVDGFPWASGVFAGPVPSYGVLDASADHRLDRHWRVEIDVANLLDREHYEAFGGAVLRRRLLGSVVYAW